MLQIVVLIGGLPLGPVRLGQGRLSTAANDSGQLAPLLRFLHGYGDEVIEPQ